MIDPHQDASEYWQRLRKDKPSNLAVGGLVIGALATTVSLMALVFPHSDGAMHNRGNPLYWLLMLPFALWGWDLSTFSPRSVRTMRPAMIVLPTLCGVILIVARHDDQDVLGGLDTGSWMILAAFLVTAIGSLVSWMSLSRSLLQREGPDRRLMKPVEAARRSAVSRSPTGTSKPVASTYERHSVKTRQMRRRSPP